MNPTLGAGCPPEYATPFGGFSLSINAKDVAEAERLFAGTPKAER